jgi:hypothetical protein
MIFKITCAICKREREDKPYSDCPYCGWGDSEFEDVVEDDEIEPYNLISKNKARELLAKGLDVFGNPLS